METAEADYSALMLGKLLALSALCATFIAPARYAPQPVDQPGSKTTDRIGFATLEGTVGYSAGDTAPKGFDAKAVKDVLERAKSQGCTVVMLEVESPGGIVPEGEKIVEVLLEAQRKGTRVIAWYGQAFSAASWIPFSCKQAVAKPTGTCGGSVIWSTGPDGKPTPVPAKMASATIAKIKNAASFTGRSPVLVDAIFDQSAEVWESTDGKVSASSKSDTDVRIDSGTTVLNMDTKFAKDIGFAVAICDSKDTAAAACGMKSPAWIDLTPIVQGRSSTIARSERLWLDRTNAWVALLPELVRKIGQAIDDSRETARFYESDQVDTTGRYKNLGKRSRDDLRKFVNDTFKKVAIPTEFDEALYLQGSETVRNRVSAAHRMVGDNVDKIIKLLAKRTTKDVSEADAVARQMLADVRSMLSADE
jgi:hypothetical protein